MEPKGNDMADELVAEMAKHYAELAWPGMRWTSWMEGDRATMIKRFTKAYGAARARLSRPSTADAVAAERRGDIMKITDSRGEPFKECPHPDIYDRGECCGGECVYPHPSPRGGAEPARYVCPKCGSLDIIIESGIGLRAFCRDCRHFGGAHTFRHPIGETGATDEPAEMLPEDGAWLAKLDRIALGAGGTDELSDARSQKIVGRDAYMQLVFEGYSIVALSALTSLRAERDFAVGRARSLEAAAESARQLEAQGYKALHYSDELARAEAAESSLAAEKLKVAELEIAIKIKADEISDLKEFAKLDSAAAEQRVAALVGAREPTHRHLKSGHLVREIGRGFAQVSVHPIEEMSAVSIYEHDGKLWVRNAVEFDDGRFAALATEA